MFVYLLILIPLSTTPLYSCSCRCSARSTTVNKARLKQVEARNQIVEDMVKHAAKDIATVAQGSPQTYKTLIVDLITEAALRFQEPRLLVKCRREDVSVVQASLELASAKYSKVVKEQADVNRVVAFTLDSERLPPGPSAEGQDAGLTCCGGVVVTSEDRRVVVDNTLDSRITIGVTDCLPTIRNMLFSPAT
eukprot:GHVU01216153.1.p2 GENE.GHVU01216153.1~~GHVU01216153.1.p2  ORF type:complete len:192 (-),score=45.55 GHVU01216153.1:511-1086(-)